MSVNASQFFSGITKCNTHVGSKKLYVNCDSKKEANDIVDGLKAFDFDAKVVTSKDKSNHSHYNAVIPKTQETGFQVLKDIGAKFNGDISNIHAGKSNYLINLSSKGKIKNNLPGSVVVDTVVNTNGQASLKINKNDWHNLLHSPVVSTLPTPMAAFNQQIARAAPKGHTAVPGDNSTFGGSDHPRIQVTLPKSSVSILTQNLAFQVTCNPTSKNYNGGRPPIDSNGNPRDETTAEAKNRQKADLKVLLKSQGVVQISELDFSLRNGEAQKLGKKLGYEVVEEGEFITFLPKGFKVLDAHCSNGVGLFLLVERKGTQYVLGNLHIKFGTTPDLTSLVKKLDPKSGTEVVLSGDMNADPARFAAKNQTCTVASEANIKWENNSSSWGKTVVDGTIAWTA